MQVSVIIVNYNTSQLAINAIESLFAHTSEINLEVIVVDNHSTEPAREILSERFGDRVRFMGLFENVGFGRANNEGIKVADPKSDYLFLLNPDTLLCNNAVKILIDYMERHPEVGAAGGNLYDAQERPSFSYHRYMPNIWTSELQVLTFGIPFRWMQNTTYNTTADPIQVGYLSGADMMLRRKALVQIGGGFDPDFFMYGEDVELCLRIHRAGYAVVNVPQAQIIHLEGQSFQFKPQRIRMTLESGQIYLRKTRSKRYIWWANHIFLLGLRTRRVLYYFASRERKEGIRYTLSTFNEIRSKNILSEQSANSEGSR